MSVADEELIARNFQIVKTAKQKLKLTKRIPLKSEIKRRIYITDERRTYSQLMLNAFNSCDSNKLGKTFDIYCRSDITSVAFYEGGKNPMGSNSAEYRTIPVLTTYWESLFKSAPDFLFESQFVTAYTDTISGVSVVRSRFRMMGTRILDIKLAKKHNADTIRKKLKQKEKFSTNENVLMTEIQCQIDVKNNPAVSGNNVERVDGNIVAVEDDVEDDLYLDDLILYVSEEIPPILTDLPLTNIPPTDIQSADSLTAMSQTDSGPATKEETVSKKRKAPSSAAVEKAQLRVAAAAAARKARASAAKMTSIFACGESIVATEGAQIYLDTVPLAKALDLRYRGTFTVYLDADDKIFRCEFIYTAEDVFLAAAAAAEAAEASDELVDADYEANDNNSSSSGSAASSTRGGEDGEIR